MQLFGYDDHKKVVPVDLSVDRIVESGIDPWRLDLFDQDGVTIRYGWTLNRRHFRKLTDIAFAYKFHNDARIFVGFHDGSQTVCLVGEPDDRIEKREGKIIVHKLCASAQPFSFHFAEYLEQLELNPQREGSNVIVSKSRPRGFAPKSAGAVTIRGKELIFDSSPDSPFCLKAPTFVGRMLLEMNVGCLLPDEINWVFERFEQWSPIVWGDAIRRSYWKQPIDKINIALGRIEIKELCRLMSEPGFASGITGLEEKSRYLTFQRHGCTYFIECDDDPATRMRHSELDRMQLFHTRTCQSKERVYSTKEGEIRGSRVVLFDLANGQSRAMRPQNAVIEIEKTSDHISKLFRHHI